MREILFRGKVYDTTLEYKKGDWVFGNLIEMNDTHECYIRLKERRFYVKVDPNTVSQFTGVIDSCKQKVFEGDIIQTIEKKPIVGIVKWYKYESRFIIESNVKDKEIGAFSVIGNIWDRKKLKDEIKMSAVILRTVDKRDILNE